MMVPFWHMENIDTYCWGQESSLEGLLRTELHFDFLDTPNSEKLYVSQFIKAYFYDNCVTSSYHLQFIT